MPVTDNHRIATPRALRDIEAGLKRLTTGLRALAREINAGGAGERRRRRVTPALRLQGRYMGLVRSLPPRDKRRVRAIRASRGVREAIRAARRLRA
jgi:hypothetical protein